MKIVLATGIYPPAIGGPATYVAAVAEEMKKKGHEVTVLTYGEVVSGQWSHLRPPKADYGGQAVVSCDVVQVSKEGGPILRWRRYAKALKQYGTDADRIYVFTSVSAGIPLILSGLKKPKKILRLGGDFFWERYTDNSGTMSLRAWYGSRFGFWRLLNTLFMPAILAAFDTIVYSTDFQREIHQQAYGELPSVVIRNAIPNRKATLHSPHEPLRLLFMGRFVRFKNISNLLIAVAAIPHVTLTLIGEGPMRDKIVSEAHALSLEDRVTVLTPVHGEEKNEIFDWHDLLILPSVTEISPNTALEAAARSLPVLLTSETGIKDVPGIAPHSLRTAKEIETALHIVMRKYPTISESIPARTYEMVTRELLSAP